MTTRKTANGTTMELDNKPVNKVLRAKGDLSSRTPSRLPTSVQFPLVVILSLSISSLGYSFLNEWTRGAFAAVAKPLTNVEVAILAGWRVTELSLGWYGNYDSLDLAALSLLSHGPTIYLLTTFYGIHPLTAAAALSIDALSSYLPYGLLRPLSAAHSARSSRTTTTPNREIITDVALLVYNGILVALVYTVTLFVALKTVLPAALVLHFNGIPTIEPAHDATLLWPPAVGPLAVAFGVAAPLFIFTPAAAADEGSDRAAARFDPVEASLAETVWWNLWGYTAPSKVAIKRTAVLVLVTWVSTFLQCSLTVYGIEAAGAASYATVWAAAALLAGAGLQFVGSA